ncbi:hypothetical protein N1F78_01125 [Seonamhaeicola sp. MEBiC1930]|uniref:hypothetical protein n=1 Tax=Seonamhaeicola sp. MEBiC01930 TaxID=2976768 RepID=UPI00324AF1FF
MISSAEEFKRLRTSENLEEQERSASESADIGVWHEVIQKFPELKEWVVHNKTIQIEILEYLASDKDEKVRYAIARKRKINNRIFDMLKSDIDKSVRHALICNTKLTSDLKRNIKTDDSDWLKKALKEKIKTGANNV